MSTTIRNEVSRRSKYYISKHRHLELKHFCLQYQDWEKEYGELVILPGRNINYIHGSNVTNQVEHIAEKSAELYYKMNLIKQTCIEADRELANYIFKCVTGNVGYVYLQTVLGIPCGKDMFYDRYRRFFWLLDKKK